MNHTSDISNSYFFTWKWRAAKKTTQRTTAPLRARFEKKRETLVKLFESQFVMFVSIKLLIRQNDARWQLTIIFQREMFDGSTVKVLLKGRPEVFSHVSCKQHTLKIALLVILNRNIPYVD